MQNNRSVKFILPYEDDGVDPEYRSLVHDKIRELKDIYETTYGISAPYPEVRFNITGRCAGQASSYYCRIKLNKELLNRYGVEFINRTVVHEYAHILTDWHWSTYNNKISKQPHPHGIEWKRMMILCGISKPERCHNYEVQPSRRQRRYAYSCKCGENRIHAVSATKHNKMTSDRKLWYKCNDCKTKIEFTGIVL